tara:strand:+ start:484 stop:1389 length:906 start_codon:yes stop_codon:yes gene_type:complete
MNKTISIVLLLLVTVGMYAQDGINYKALIKDNLGAVVANQTIDVRFTIIADTGPTNVYIETHTGATTDANGIVILTIGSVITPTLGVFADIAWSSDTHSLKVEIDIEQDASFVDMGTTQFMSVPYALHAETAESVTSTCGLAIGDTHQGGIIFYLDASGCHGLIAAPSDQSTGIAWWNGSFVDTYAYGNGIGAGEGNSQGIRWWQGSCSSCYASELCQNLSLGGYTDWYLPSKYELNLMYENIGQGDALGLGNIGNFVNSFYWSSTETNFVNAWVQSFDSGSRGFVNKDRTYSSVRAVRAF